MRNMLLGLLVLGGLVGLIGVVAVGTPDQSLSNPYLKLSPDKLIEQGRSLDKRIADSNKPKPIKDIVLVEKKEVEQTRVALENIDHDAPEYKEARQVLASIDKNLAEGKRLAQAAVAKVIAEDVDGRKAFAKQYEHNALMAGYSVTVSTSGPKATTLNIDYPGFTKASIYQLINDNKFMDGLRTIGFAKIHLTDGYRSSNVDLH